MYVCTKRQNTTSRRRYPARRTRQSRSGEVLERELEHSLRCLLGQEVPSAADLLDAQVAARLRVEHAPYRAVLAYHQQRGDVEFIGPVAVQEAGRQLTGDEAVVAGRARVRASRLAQHAGVCVELVVAPIASPGRSHTG